MAKGPKTTKRIPVTLPSGSIYLLNQLVEKKTLGETAAEVAKHLLIATSDAMVERKRIDDVPVKPEDER